MTAAIRYIHNACATFTSLGCRALILLPALLGSIALAEADTSQLDFANGLFARGFYEEAMEEYEDYLSAASETTDAVGTAWLRLGRCAIALQSYEKALQAFDHALTYSVSQTLRREAQVSTGEAHFFMSNYEDALKALQNVIGKETPEALRARALYYSGRSYAETGNNEQACARFSTLVEELPHTALVGFAQYQLGFAYLNGGHDEKAAQAFSAAANNTDADDGLRMESRFRAAELFDKLGWTEAALGAYEQLRADYPDSEFSRRADYGYSWALYHGGRYDDAFTLADSLTQGEGALPQVAGYYYLQGNCRYQQKRYGEALSWYAKLIQQYPESAFVEQACYKTAWAQHFSGEDSAAESTVSLFLQQYPDSLHYGEMLYLLGTLKVLSGDYEMALQHFQAVVENYGTGEFSAEALFKMGECYAQLGLGDEAARSFESFTRQYPAHSLTEQAMIRSGDARFTAQDFADALANYKGILEKEGNDPALEEEALYRLAVTFHNMQDYKESSTAFHQLLEKYPEGKYAMESYFRIGEFELRQNKDPFKAIEAYEAALAANPDHALAAAIIQGLTTARYEQKDFEEAAAGVLQLIHKYPESPLPVEAYLWCAQWLNQAEREQEAIEVFSTLLQVYPLYEQRGDILYILGQAEEKLEAFDQAITYYKDAITTDPVPLRNAEIHNRLGKLYETRTEYEEAERVYEDATHLDGGEQSARARFNLAALYETRGDKELAARHYMRLAILFVHETLSPEALWRAGNCYLELDQKDQAHSIFRELINDYPDAPQVKDVRNVLKHPGEAAPNTTAE